MIAQSCVSYVQRKDNFKWLQGQFIFGVKVWNFENFFKFEPNISEPHVNRDILLLQDIEVDQIFLYNFPQVNKTLTLKLEQTCVIFFSSFLKKLVKISRKMGFSRFYNRLP